MDADNYVPISLIASFKLIKRLTHDLQLITDILKESSLVEVDRDEKKVRSSDIKTYLPTRKRCIIILRNVPFDATEIEILDIFLNNHCPVSAIGCERVLEFDHSDCWYVTFNSEDDAQNAFLYLTQENISIRGQKILVNFKKNFISKIIEIFQARMKACLSQKPSVPIPEQYIQSVPANPIVDNHPQQYYQHHPTYPYPNYYPQTQFINRNVR
jgi:la-related protein 4